MPLIEWNAGLSLGIDEIDRQHKKWIDIINELHESLISTQGFETLGKTTKDMEDYVDYHFAEEEKYMEKIRYPGLARHKKIHADFKNQVIKLKREVLSGEIVLRTQVMSIIKNWLVDHILNEDKKYSQFTAPTRP